MTSLAHLLFADDAFGVTGRLTVTPAAEVSTHHASVKKNRVQSTVAITARCVFRGVPVLLALLFVRTVYQIANRSRVALVDKLRRLRNLANTRCTQVQERGDAMPGTSTRRRAVLKRFEASRSA